ncbi:MAG: ABC-F type ribosomal protection protein [Clostridiaceae bacterium]|nr:ABC-F type ribosomal protection protein [Clostridiaceae bacterium]
MLLAHMSGIKKYYNDRLVLDVEDFKIYKNDRIGIVGLNGSGKTTLLNILTGKISPDEGLASIFVNYSYITQLEYEGCDEIDGFNASKLKVNDLGGTDLSGGEMTRFKIAKALSNNSALIIGDEPTSNLDQEGIEILQKELKAFDGAILLVSHDRHFLDEICTSILEIEDGRVKLYKGNYSKYKELKQRERERKEFEYWQYIGEKERLLQVIEEKRQKIKSMRKTPKRMGNSEARLHKMASQNAKKNIDKQINAVRTRINKLEAKEKPKDLPEIKIDIQENRKLHCKVVVNSKNLNKRFGNKIIFKDAEFKILNNSKTAIIGPNGSGKTTLLKMIIERDRSVNIAHGVKIGYFSQDMGILKGDKTLLQNVMEDSRFSETFIRILLARLFFKREDLSKKVSVLSGGEKVKALLAKIIVSDYNVLVLDEPTNYLDIYSMEAVEDALNKYEGTVIFVSHDRRFVNNIADHIISIENQKTICFNGTLKEFNNLKMEPTKKEITDLMLLENRMVQILSKLSSPSKDDDVEALDKEYNELLIKLKHLKK